MKIKITVVALFMSLTPASSFAADSALSRPEAVAAYHARFDQQFNEIQSRLLDAKAKAAGVKSISDSIAVALKDFDQEIQLLSGTLNDPNASVDTAIGYAIEEIGELQWDVSTIETNLTKVRTIKCIKGSKIMSIKEVAPKCPKGFRVKK